MRLAALGLLLLFTADASRATPTPAPDLEVPMSLTAADGTGLALVELKARAVVHDVVSFTELTLVFENPEARVIEGQFRITLPEGASLSRFAMRQGERYQEGEVVERQAARRAYEDFLHRRQDPALLEASAGNEFSARVFPIGPRERKELVLSYSELRARAADPYVLRLRGLPRLGRLDARVVDWSSGAARPTSANVSNEVPAADLVVPIAASARPYARQGELVIGRLTPVASTTRDAPLEGLVVLFDTSASRALGLAGQTARLVELIRALTPSVGAGAPLLVAAFDQAAEVVFDGTFGSFDDAAARKLIARRALGASDVLGAVRAVGGKVSGRKGLTRWLLVGDAVQTVGESDDAALRTAFGAAKGAKRLDVLLEGGLRDTAFAERLAHGVLPQAGVVADGSAGASVLAAKLLKATRAQLGVSASGASFVGPSRLDGVQAGDEVLVVARAANNQPVELRAGEARLVVPPGDTGASRELLARAVAQVEIETLSQAREALEGAQRERRQELAERIVALSVKERVLSPLTALLVLETEEDYARYGIDRRALADILTVRGDVIAKVDRAKTTLTVAVAPPARPQPRQDAPENERRGGPEGDASEGGAPEPAPGDAPPPAGAASSSADLAAAPPPSPAPRAPEREEMQKSVASDEDVVAPLVGGSASGRQGAAASSGPRSERPSARQEAPRGDGRQREAPQQVAVDEERGDEAEVSGAPPYTGRFAEVMELVGKRSLSRAKELAWRWRDEDHGDVLALLALGEVCEKTGELELAARAYGSLIDLFPNRADLRRYAGARLERVGSAAALALAVDTFAKARDSRPDHPASHHMLAMALLSAKEWRAALDTVLAALAREFGRFEAADRILREDAGIIAAAWLKAEPQRGAEVKKLLAAAEVALATEPSLRFVLTWETDANDVDFHIFDGKKNHAYYSERTLRSGGELYADITTGYGPECFTIPGRARAFPYALKAHYYSRGPMGYGMGKLDVVSHDGRGGVRVERRPFVVMQDGAYVDLGKVAQ